MHCEEQQQDKEDGEEEVMRWGKGQQKRFRKTKRPKSTDDIENATLKKAKLQKRNRIVGANHSRKGNEQAEQQLWWERKLELRNEELRQHQQSHATLLQKQQLQQQQQQLMNIAILKRAYHAKHFITLLNWPLRSMDRYGPLQYF